MAKTFYSSEEAAVRLGVSGDDLKGLVRSGKLREFRDAGKVNFKVDEVDRLVSQRGGGSSLGGSGELLLEPAEGSSIHLAPMSGSDAIKLSDTDLEDTATGMKAKKDKGGSVGPSVGVSVFDEEDVRSVDPLAETVMAADSDPLGIEGTGSGSGLLDLTRESDDTSLGAELLDEIAPADDSSMQMGEATRAGLEQAIVEPKGEIRESVKAGTAVAAPRVRQVVDYGPDAASIGMGAMTTVAVIVMLFTGFGAAAVGRGVWPAFMNSIYQQLWIYGVAALAVAILAWVIGYFLGKRAA